MSYAVKILAQADTDAVEAALWYERQVPGLGVEFLLEVDSAAQKLVQHPEIHQIRFVDVRRAPLHRFKFYGLYYLVRGKDVWVIAVHHGCRHPGWLRKRRRQLD